MEDKRKIEFMGRRSMLKNMGLAGMAVALFSAGKTAGVEPLPQEAADELFERVNVKSFGAIGDGKTDDTAAFQRALDSLASHKSGTVFVPDGYFAIRGHLTIPEGVTLCGTLEAPVYAIGSPQGGSCLLAFEGADDPKGTPFITLTTNSTVKGIKIYYPEQQQTSVPVPYPWTIASGGGRSMSIIDVLLVNPYQAVDFGSRNSSPHYIRNLYAYPLYRGVYVDRCYDSGKMENVILWPFWNPNTNSDLRKFVKQNCQGFILGRTDWQTMINCFAIFTNIGYRFTDHNPPDTARFEPSKEAYGGAQGANVMIYSGGADMCDAAVKVEQCQYHGGISFSGSQIYGDLVVDKTNRGPVKFDACGFFGSIDGRRGVGIAATDGDGKVSFSNCNFMLYTGRKVCNPDVLFRVDGGRIGINGCTFMTYKDSPFWADPPAIRIGKNVKAALITANEFYGRPRIETEAPDRTVIANNIEQTEELS
jgi:hypothetical protein